MPKTLKVEQVQGGSKKANSLAKLGRIGEARKSRSAPYENMYQVAKKRAINKQRAKAGRK